jgi:hypothetical protein
MTMNSRIEMCRRAPYLMADVHHLMPDGRVRIMQQFDLRHPLCPIKTVARDTFGDVEAPAWVIQSTLFTREEYLDLFGDTLPVPVELQ